MNKAELAKAFDVSVNTIDKWLARGCPYVEKGTNGKEYEFDLKAVMAWRNRRTGRGNAPEPGLADELLSIRPDFENPFRMINEEALNSFLNHLHRTESDKALEALYQVTGHKKHALLYYVLIWGVILRAVTTWIEQDILFSELRKTGADLDHFARDLTGCPIQTKPPENLEGNSLIRPPEFITMDEDEFIEKHWKEKTLNL